MAVIECSNSAVVELPTQVVPNLLKGGLVLWSIKVMLDIRRAMTCFEWRCSPVTASSKPLMRLLLLTA